MNTLAICRHISRITSNQKAMSVVNYEEVKNLPKTSLLVDVREPAELKETGVLPNSVNIPLGQLVDAFNAPEGDFQSKYGCPKPTLDQNVVFSCKMGGRALRALESVAKLGYNNLSYYKGSWMDWEAKSKQ